MLYLLHLFLLKCKSMMSSLLLRILHFQFHPFSFKLDNSHVSFYTCLDESIRICVNLNKNVKIDLFAECIRLSYHYCLADLIMHRQDPKWQKAKQSYHYCFEQHKSLIHFASCLLEWFETEMYWDVVYTENSRASYSFRFGK